MAMSSAWVSEYSSRLGDQSTSSPPPKVPLRPRSRASTPSLSRTPSRETLFIDTSAEKHLSPTSDMFLSSLLHHETNQPLPTIEEAVGFAKSGIGQGSLVSSVFTLVASAMGAGCLSLPHMFRQSGVGAGIILLACGALLAHVSLVVLMSCARYTQCKSFAELVSRSTGESTDDHPRSTSRNILVDVVISLYGMAAVLIYTMLIGDFLTGIMQSPLFRYINVSRQDIILGSLAITFPLSVPKSVTALRHISILSTSAIAFMTLVVLAKMPTFAFNQPSEDDMAEGGGAGGTLCFFTGSLHTTLQSFAIALFSFNAHTNAIPVAVALDQPRAVRIWQVSIISVLIEFAIYALIATGGYLSFGDSTHQDFIRNYPTDDLMILIVRCIYSVPILFGVPINLSPAAASMQALARHAFKGRARVDQDSDGGPASRAFHVILVALVLCLCAAMAIYCEAIADMISLFGGCFGTLICLVWPYIIYRQILCKLHSRRLSLAIRLALVLAAALGLAAFLDQVATSLFGT